MNERVFLVSSSEGTAQTLTALLQKERHASLEAAASGAAARRRLSGTAAWEVALVNTPLGDEFGDELAVALAKGTDAGVVLLVKSEMAAEVAGKVAGSGVMILPKPISRALLFQTVEVARVLHDRVASLQSENHKLQKRLEELRMVDRAKCALIQYRGMTEVEAHKFIEREAMDSRITKKQVAEELVRNFGG